MQNNFDISTFINNLGEDLITIFNRSSEQCIHPDEVGRAKEINISKQIESLLPHGVGVGRGYVFDSYGGISNQCDFILYEKDLIPVFVRDSNTDYSYYPCEGVIAVGEIKSTLNTDNFQDSIEKLGKIKDLKRHCEDDHNFRHYLQSIIISGADIEKYDPENKTLDNIFTFVFCKDNAISGKTMLDILIDRYKENMEYGIDRVYSLNRNEVVKMFISTDQKQLCSTVKSNSYCTARSDNAAFELLIDDLSVFVRCGRTQQFNMRNYYKLKERYIEESRLIKQE